jgi:hypothetical protein
MSMIAERVRSSSAPLLLALALLLPGCAKETIGPPPAAPVVELAPVRAIPADLDVVVRLDVARLREVLGAPALEALRHTVSFVDGSEDAGTARFVTDAILKTRVLYLGFRPGPGLSPQDSVIVLEGRFSQLDPREYGGVPAWQSPVDLGGSWLRYDRDQPARSAPARIYAQSNRLLVLVTTAEIDSVERRVERGSADEGALEPRASGVVSVAVRLRPLAARMRRESPQAARLLGRATELEAHGDLGSVEAHLELVLKVETPEEAARIAEAARAFAELIARYDQRMRALLEGFEVEAVGGTVGARLRVPRETLAEWTRREARELGLPLHEAGPAQGPIEHSVVP